MPETVPPAPDSVGSPSRADVTSRPAQRRIAWACVVGNFMEYFDFSLFGFFAVSIGRSFFPATSPTASLLQTFAAFGVAFAVRPLGGLVFGLIADRAGRRASLSLCILLMGLSTTLIAVVPAYASIGIWAPVLLVALRCLAGLSIGGEFSGSSAYLIETAPPGRRGVRASFVSLGGASGLLTGGVCALVLQLSVTAPQLDSWGWRLPFLLAAPLTVVGLYIRSRLEDTPVFHALLESASERPRWRDAFRREHLRPLVLTFCFSIICGVGYYYFTSFAVTYLVTSAGLGRTESVLLVSAGLLVYALLCPLAGRASDRWGRRPTVLVSGIGYTLLGIPLFLLLSAGQAWTALVALLGFAALQALVNVNTSLLLIELFPARTRLTSASVGFNIAVGPPSGFAPLIGAALAAGTGIAWAPSFYLVGMCLVGSVGLLLLLPETRGRDLVQDVAATAADASTGAAAPRANAEAR